MEISYDRICQRIKHFNVRPLSDKDFWRIAKRERIVVKEIPLVVDGYYQKKRGRHFIIINSRLRGMKWLHTAFHELMHYFLDVPMATEEATLYRRSKKTKRPLRREEIADAFALMAILPFPELEKLSAEDLHDHPVLAPLVVARLQAYKDFGK